MKLILCPTDFSENSEHAIEYAIALAENFSAQIVILHVFESPMFSGTGFTVIHDAAQQMRDQAEDKLNALKERFASQHPQLSFDIQIAEGASYDQIVTISNRLNADLIVIGATGYNKLERLLMGSVTSKVIHEAACPVLCIPKNSKYRPVTMLLYATDLNEDSIAAAHSIVPFARKFDAEIAFVFVDDKHVTHSNQEIEEITRKLSGELQYEKISGHIADNKSVTAGLENYLKEHPADILVMFSHRKDFPQSLFHQSLTKTMSHQSRIPLLALKTAGRKLE